MDIQISMSKDDISVDIISDVLIKVNNFEKIWFTLDIIKDKRETAELYVNNLALGNFKIPILFLNLSVK